MAANVEFDSFSLQRDEIVTTEIVDLQAPDRTLNIGKRGRDDFSVFTSEYFDSKSIQVSGYLVTTTESGLRGLVDDFKQAMSRTQKDLDITRNDGVTRRYTGTSASIEVLQENIETTRARFTVGFRLPDPFGEDTTSQSGSFITSTAITNTEITISGTYPARPTIRLDLLSGSLGSLFLENTTLSGRLSIFHSVPAGGDLTINANTFAVTSSGNQVDYTGVFPLFRTYQEGINNLQTSISGSGFNALMTVDYTNKYL